MPGFRSKKLIAALTLGLLLSACGDSPEKMMISARDYLAKGDVNAATIQLKNALQIDPTLFAVELELHEATRRHEQEPPIDHDACGAVLGESRFGIAGLGRLVASTVHGPTESLPRRLQDLEGQGNNLLGRLDLEGLLGDGDQGVVELAKGLLVTALGHVRSRVEAR